MRRALYRKYRPRLLSEVVGQEHITNALEKSLKSEKVSHAYLFIGPRGTGKTSVARILAHEINKFDYELEDDHLDIVEIDAASNTGVDNIRNLREKAMVAPSKGKYKVYIIDEVHMLSKSAFNALLKTLEEPPAHVIFIMATTDAHKVPITITSRSQTHTFKLASSETMQKHLSAVAKAENINIAEDAIKIVAKHGKGSFRDSLSLLDQISTIDSSEITCDLLNSSLGLPSDELIDQLLSSYSLGDSTSASSSLQSLLDQGIKPEILAENLMTAIIKNPKPELLPLLNRLTEIPHGHYPEVKLLLALLGNQPTPSIIPQPISAEATKVKLEKTTGPSFQTVRSHDEDLAERPVTTDARNVSEKNGPESSPTSPNSNPTSTSWEELLSTIKKDNAAVYSFLTKSTADFTKQKLTIYNKTPMVRTKLQSKLPYISSFLPEDTIIEILDQKPSTDPVISNIENIFGTVEEISKIDEF